MNDCVIYLRTSTKDQHPEAQLEECKRFAIARGYNIKQIYTDKLSGFKKDVYRPHYESIKNLAYKGEIKAVIVWALDRWIRNRDTLLEDVIVLRSHHCKLHSVKEEWLETINIEGSLGKTIQDFLLGLLGSLAEMESQRKSERVRLAYDRIKKENRKYKKWGRKELNDRVKQQVIKLYDRGKSQRQISKEVLYYDRNKNEKFISLGKVNQIIKEYKKNLCS